MIETLNTTASRISYSAQLQRSNAYAQVLELAPLFQEHFAEDVQVELDWASHELGGAVIIQAKNSGGGRCTRHIRADLLARKGWVAGVLGEMQTVLERVAAWLAELDRLYKQIRQWIDAESPALRVKEFPHCAAEALSGEYPAKKLIISEGDHSMEVRPKGAWVVAAEGMVELIGEEQQYALVFSPPDGGWVWVDDSLLVQLQPLTGPLFLRLVRDCLK